MELLSLYQTGLKGEQAWVQQMQHRIDGQPALTNDVNQVKSLVEPTMVIIRIIAPLPPSLESVCSRTHGLATVIMR